MSKSYKKRHEEDSDDSDEYNDLKQRAVDRRKKKRLVRALKIKDIDTLLEDDIYGDEFSG
jgi:hypothetical protein